MENNEYNTCSNKNVNYLKKYYFKGTFSDSILLTKTTKEQNVLQTRQTGREKSV